MTLSLSNRHFLSPYLPSSLLHSLPFFFLSCPFFFFLPLCLPPSLPLYFPLFLPIFLSAFFFCYESFSESTFSLMGSLTIPDQENLQNSYCLPCIQLITHNCFHVQRIYFPLLLLVPTWPRRDSSVERLSPWRPTAHREEPNTASNPLPHRTPSVDKPRSDLGAEERRYLIFRGA